MEATTRRTFAPAMRKALHRFYAGTCAACGSDVATAGEADHVIPFALGGATTAGNAQLLCVACNRSKGAKPGSRALFTVAKPPLTATLRKWQGECLREQLAAIEAGERGFFVAAGVGSGKTAQALALYLSGPFDLIVVVTPRSGVRGSWTKDAKNLGIKLETVVSSASFSPDTRAATVNGYVLNAGMLASVANDLAILCEYFRVLVVLDEAHHYGEGMSWAENVSTALGAAAFTIGLSGTPYRSDDKQIAVLDYVAQGSGLKGSPSYRRSYAQGVAAGEAAIVITRYIGGSVEKRNVDTGASEVFDYADGDYSVVSGRPDESLMRQRLRVSAVDSLDWQMAMVKEARDVLLAKRAESGFPWAGLIACGTIAQSEAVAAEIERRFGDKVMLLVADAETEEGVERFNDDISYAWVVSITKVAEGVNIDRLIVGAILTPTTTKSHFEQLRGRIVRLVRGIRQIDQIATLFIPSDPRFMDHAVESNDLMMHYIPAPAADASPDDAYVGSDEDPALTLDGLEMGTRGATVGEMRDALEQIRASSRREVIDVGNFVLIARPVMDGGVIGEETFTEAQYAAIRERLAVHFHPITVARMPRGVASLLNDILNEV